MRHWLELRRRIFRILGLFLILFVITYLNFDLSVQLLFHPLLTTFIQPDALILTHLGQSLFLSLEWSAQFAWLITLPYAILELWWFIVPGLYQQEKRRGYQYLGASFLLFITGVAFSYWIILPWMFQWLAHQTPQSMRLMLEASEAWDWMLHLMMIFGLCFQLPLVCIGITQWGLISVPQLRQARRFIIVACFFFGMVLAPPDVGSQTLIALPLWGLYEIGLIASHRFEKPRKNLAFSYKNG